MNTTDDQDQSLIPQSEANPQSAGAPHSEVLIAEHGASATISEIKIQNSKFKNALVPITHALEATDAQPLSQVATQTNRRPRRKGRVASLPKVQRDMVNRMLWNGVPYKNIVAALDDAGFTLIERNISNWATGGYLEWRLEQEAVLENHLNQDHLL